jgi:hypothetical protein
MLRDYISPHTQDNPAREYRVDDSLGAAITIAGQNIPQEMMGALTGSGDSSNGADRDDCITHGFRNAPDHKERRTDMVPMMTTLAREKTVHVG